MKIFFTVLKSTAPILINEDNAKRISELGKIDARDELRSLIDNTSLASKIPKKDRYKVFRESENIFSDILNRSISKNEEIASLRGFSSAKEQIFIEDALNPNMFDDLIKMTYSNNSIFSKYLNLTREYLFDSKMSIVDFKKDSDIEKSLPSTIDESLALTLNVAALLGEEYQKIILRANDEKWIDYVKVPGKDTGAAHIGIYKHHGFIRMSHNSSIASSFTLAHETGHALAGTLSKQRNNYLNASYLNSITMSEVAAFVAEFLLMKIMILEPKVEILLPKLRLILNRLHISLVESPLLADFQHKQHLKILKGDNLRPDELAYEYYKNYLDYYGSDFIPEVWGYEYLQKKHLGNNYYAPKYPIARVISIAIASQIYNKVPGALENYYEFLKAGTTMPYSESLKPFGIDLNNLENAFNAAYSEIAKITDVFEETVHRARK